MSPEQCYELICLALCVWRESRGEDSAARFSVACSIRNRVRNPKWWGSSYSSVVLHPKQYSCFNIDDPNVSKWPSAQDINWQGCLHIAQSVMDGANDTTNGATHYVSGSIHPIWIDSMELTLEAGAFRFYK